MKERWAEAIGKAFPEGHAPGYPGYPLLGEEMLQAQRSQPGAWSLRLALCQPCSASQLAALLDDVQQVRLVGEAMSVLDHLPSGVELYTEEEAGWALQSRQAQSVGPLSGERLTWKRQDQARVEQVVLADSTLLRNLALLRSLPLQHPEVQGWVVRSSRSAAGEAESLIADTLAYLAGAVAGVGVLEVEQQPGESFDTLWPRLNIPRLLRWEAGLGEPGDALAGAGIFEALSRLALDGRATAV